MNTTEKLLLMIFFSSYFVGICRGYQSFARPRIIGGELAKIRDFPYQLSLERDDGYGYEHICGASVISELWAVTAGHCVYSLQVYTYRLRGGTKYKEAGGHKHNIEEIIIHPAYDDATLDFDIAVLRVSKPFQFSDKLQPIEIAKMTPPAGTLVVLSGWGCINYNGDETKQLRRLSLNIVDHGECQAVSPIYRDIIPPILCAEASDGDKDACKGDSGGPLVTEEKQLVGIAIRASPIIPVIHTNVVYLRDWITNVTGIA